MRLSLLKLCYWQETCLPEHRYRSLGSLPINIRDKTKEPNHRSMTSFVFSTHFNWCLARGSVQPPLIDKRSVNLRLFLSLTFLRHTLISRRDRFSNRCCQARASCSYFTCAHHSAWEPQGGEKSFYVPGEWLEVRE